MADPIHQFQIKPLLPLGGDIHLDFTNSSFYMLLAVGITGALMLGATASRRIVPSRIQSVAELAYEFVADTIRNTIGEGGMKFFPLVFFTVIIYGFWKNGLHFFNLFVPKGIPIYILPLIVFIEVLSFLSRPISHSVRLFANMLAGHITLFVFASFVTMLGGLGVLGWFGATLPLALTVALVGLELLVAFLQAYVFTILTCIYLNDALHPGH